MKSDGLRYKRGRRGERWELSFHGLGSCTASDLCLEVKPLEVQLSAPGLGELHIKVPQHAAVDLDRCGSRLAHGVLTVSWPPAHAEYSHKCSFEFLSEAPLIFVCHDFLGAADCADVVKVAMEHGIRRTGMGDYEVKYDMSPHPLLDDALDLKSRRLLESIYERVDAACGLARHKDEQVPRVHFYPARELDHTGRMPAGLHLDSNGRPFRYVTAILYLTSVPQAGDGATVFPCVGTKAISEAGEELLRGGTQHSGNLADPDHKPLAQELIKAAEDFSGLSVFPELGKLAIFFTRLADGEIDSSSWHGGARVARAGPGGGKWILQFFKEVPAELRDQEAMARFIEGRRTLPDFTLHGVHHCVAPQKKKKKKKKKY
mmetsp:Transcript_12484/g.25361  ORF Transcript_12484/g.25361 Transcript_12484/m.25361 type:complete len:374 (-) Transcript_12484:14-1135(-)